MAETVVGCIGCDRARAAACFIRERFATMNASRCDQMNGWFIAAVTTDARLRRQQPVSEAEQQQRDQQQNSAGATHQQGDARQGRMALDSFVTFVSFGSANKRGGRRRRRCRLFGAGRRHRLCRVESTAQRRRATTARDRGRSSLAAHVVARHRQSPIANRHSPNEASAPERVTGPARRRQLTGRPTARLGARRRTTPLAESSRRPVGLLSSSARAQVRPTRRDLVWAPECALAARPHADALASHRAPRRSPPLLAWRPTTLGDERSARARESERELWRCGVCCDKSKEVAEQGDAVGDNQQSTTVAE